MFKNYTPYIPQGIGETLDMLGFMMLAAPTFVDDSGYFPDRNIDTTFYALNEGLQLIRKRLGDEKYATLVDMSAQMKAHFKADPLDETADGLAGRELILEMIDILKGRKKKDVPRN
jgi:hypothetical protein